MGESTFVNTGEQVKTSKPHPLRLQLDIPLVVAVATLIVFGLLMVYSASWDFLAARDMPVGYIQTRQFAWALLGMAIAFVISRMNYRKLFTKRNALLLMFFTLALLFVVVIVGRDPDLPNRSLLKSGSIQPSELAKLVIIIYLSVWLYSKRDQINSLTLGLFPMITIVGVSAGLVLVQPDKSAAFTLILLGAMMFFLAGGDWRKIIMVILFTSIFGLLVVLLSDYARNRVGDFWSGLRNPVEANYQALRSMEAVARGGLFGVGIGNGVTKGSGLPVPWTDSIYAVIAEETGLVGALVVLGLYILIAIRGMRIARRAPDMLGMLLASGVTFWIIMEALLNIGVVVNVFPVMGNPLPMISAGGSNMVTTLTGIGILLSINRQSGRDNFDSGSVRRSFIALTDLRGWDRRRRVSRTRRPRSTRHE